MTDYPNGVVSTSPDYSVPGELRIWSAKFPSPVKFGYIGPVPVDPLAALRGELLARMDTVLAAIKAGGGGAGVPVTPPVTPPVVPPIVPPASTADPFFPPDAALAKFPSPEDSQVIAGADGTVHGRPYVKDMNGVVHQLAFTGGRSTYVVNFIPLNISGSSSTPPASLLVRQGQVYVTLAGGQTQKRADNGGLYNTTIPPAWVTPASPGGGGTPGSPPLPALPPMPARAAIAPGSSGTVIPVGPSQSLKSLAAAFAVAKAGDKIQMDPGQTYTTAFPSIPGGLLINGGGSKFDFTDITGAALASGGKGGFVPNGECILEDMEVVGVGMTETAGALTSAFRPNDSCTYLELRRVKAHDNQCGLGSGTSPHVLVATLCDFSNNGLKVNGGSLTHDVYVGAGCRLMTLTNCVANGSVEAHAVKFRGLELRVKGGVFYAGHGKPFDIPNGTTVKCVIEGAHLIKRAGDEDHGILTYGVEGPTNGLAGVDILDCAIDAGCDNPSIKGPGGVVTIDGASHITGNKISAEGGIKVTGLP